MSSNKSNSPPYEQASSNVGSRPQTYIPSPSHFQRFLAGGVGGLCMVLVSQPLDIIKTRQQVSVHSTSISRTLKSILNQHGLKGLYRGSLPVLLGTAPAFSCDFWAYTTTRTYLNEMARKNDTRWLKEQYQRDFVAGSISGPITALLLGPMERVKVCFPPRLVIQICSNSWLASCRLFFRPQRLNLISRREWRFSEEQD